MRRSFDKKLGEGWLASVPPLPGTYRVYDAKDVLIYVGKAKHLRRRLSQYRNAKRRKKHAKMRAIVAEAHRFEYDVCGTERDALLEENRWIQAYRPKWNVAGAFHFLYPMVGVLETSGFVYFCYTTKPEKFPEFRFHGAYRSRLITREAFRSLSELLGWVASPVPRVRLLAQGGFAKRDRFAEVAGFRAVAAPWLDSLHDFLEGGSRKALEELVLALADSPQARRRPKLVQRKLEDLKRFWRHEALRLREARVRTHFASYPVPQAERDRLFILLSP
jgi:excinuclease ABC subunit C